MAKIERNKQQCQKTSVFELSKYPKMKNLSLFPFPGKIRSLFAIFGIFLPGNREESQVKGVESKFDEYFFIHVIPDQLPVKSFSSNIFQFCGYRSQRTFQKNFNLDFQFWLGFLVPLLHFLKTYLNLPGAEFNAESSSTNFR